MFFPPHAKKRMHERQVTIDEVESVLLKGQVVQLPAQEPDGSYILAIESYELRRTIKVVVNIDYDELGNKIVIVTVVEV